MTEAPVVEVIPSLLAADFSRLGDSARLAASAGADGISVDVMDGRFVPNLSFGPDHVRMLKRETTLPVDSHLMVENPETVAPWFIDAGVDTVIAHVEACRDARALAGRIRAAGRRFGLAVKPKTSETILTGLLGDLDLVLVMTVEPGFGGALFLKDMLPKITTLRRAIDRAGLRCRLQVDGGVTVETAKLAAAAGADSFVAGSSVFRSSDPGRAVREIRAAAAAEFASKFSKQIPTRD